MVRNKEEVEIMKRWYRKGMSNQKKQNCTVKINNNDTMGKIIKTFYYVPKMYRPNNIMVHNNFKYSLLNFIQKCENCLIGTCLKNVGINTKPKLLLRLYEPKRNETILKSDDEKPYFSSQFRENFVCPKVPLECGFQI